jgi:apolipoprotein N-acyltransferase
VARLLPLLPFALGVLAGFGLAPWSLWPLTLAMLALWLATLARQRTLGGALVNGWLFGLGHFIVANAWIRSAFTFQTAVPEALGWIAVVLLSAYLAVFPMLAAGLAWRLRRPGTDGRFIMAAAAGWIATEYLRGTMLTGYPWSPLGVIWIGTPVAQLARWTGTYALSGLTVLIAGALVLALRRHWRLPLATLALGTLLTLAAQRAPLPPAPNAPHLRIVQPDLPEEASPTPDYAEHNLSRLIALAGTPGFTPRLLLWPEGAVRYPLEDGYPRYAYWDLGSATLARARIADLLGPRDAVLTGGQSFGFDVHTRNMNSATNAIFALGPDARVDGRYDKAHLVPWGEYLPARGLLEPLGLARLVPGDIDFRPGPGPSDLALPGFGAIGMDICYEIIFSGHVVDAAHRPRLIFNPSDDAWFGTLGPPAHLAQARLRAIEEGLPIARATPTGISALIDADGRLLAALPLGHAGAIEAPLPAPRAPTLFARLGNSLALAIALLLAAGALAIRPARR